MKRWLLCRMRDWYALRHQWHTLAAAYCDRKRLAVLARLAEHDEKARAA